MQRSVIGITLGVVGVFVSWAGQGVWRSSPDALWAAIGVISILSALAIGFHPTVSRLISGKDPAAVLEQS
jgi:hypothetical protein